jgi:hypothetical protein
LRNAAVRLVIELSVVSPSVIGLNAELVIALDAEHDIRCNVERFRMPDRFANRKA